MQQCFSSNALLMITHQHVQTLHCPGQALRVRIIATKLYIQGDAFSLKNIIKYMGEVMGITVLCDFLK